jgi:dCMP deaminase
MAHKPEWPAYFMSIALAARARADCTGNRVGAILVKDKFIIATGYNGTPAGAPNCSEGGCERCAHPERYPSGQGYDLCICVHAEANALLMAARVGIATHGSTLYSTMRPCFGCSKELLQAGVQRVVYLHDWRHPDPTYQLAYERLQARFPDGVHQLEHPDPDASWATRRQRLP